MKQLFLVLGVLVVVGVGAYFIGFNHPQNPPHEEGASGQDLYFTQRFIQNFMSSSQHASSSQGSSITISAASLRQWFPSSVVSYAPGLVTQTLTLPASSTIPDLVPKAGDRQTFCVRNATGTAATYLTFAGGTGTNLLVASSSATALGSAVFRTGKIGCLTFIREASTTSTFDIDVLLNVYN